MHYKCHIQRLLRLHQATPAPTVFFLAGCLPFPAQLHLKIFSVFGQVCRFRGGDNILANTARIIYSSASTNSKSWFWIVRQLCLQYGLHHPCLWLIHQPSKLQVKAMSKSAVLQYWLELFRSQADSLSSLKYLKTRYLGLTKCHPIFRLCGSSPWEVEKATVQARLLSGRFRVESLTRHWTPGNRQGMCTLPGCWGSPAAHPGTVETFLLSCPSLSTTRQELAVFNCSYIAANPNLELLVNQCLEIDQVQFWIDCTTMPPVIAAGQVEGDLVLVNLLKMTRNYCYVLHKARIDLLRIA